MFTHGSVIINRPVEEVFKFVNSLNTQLRCWDVLHVPSLAILKDDDLLTQGSFKIGGALYNCVIELHRTRTGSGVVTKIAWQNGELAAEWRIMEDGNQTKVELNIEGEGGAIANPARLRPLVREILGRLKQHFDLA